MSKEETNDSLHHEDDDKKLEIQQTTEKETNSNEQSLFPLNWKDCKYWSKIVAKSGASTIASEMLYCLDDFIMIYFIGHLKNAKLIASISLGNVWSNLACLTLLFALDGGFQILASQAFGAKDYRKIKQFYYYQVILTLIVLSILSVILCFSGRFFEFIGQDSEVSQLTEEYIKLLIPKNLFNIFFEVTSTVLRSQNIFTVGPKTQAFTIIFSYSSYYMTQHVWGMGMHGVALTKNLSALMNVAILFFSIYKFNLIPEVLNEKNITLKLTELINYTRKVFALGFIRYLSCITWELHLVMIVMLNDARITASHGLLINYAYWCYTFPAGLGNAVGVLVGNAIGEKNAYKAKVISFVSACWNMIILIVISIFTILMKPKIASYYTNDESIIPILTNMLDYYQIMFIMDSQLPLTGRLLRCFGYEKFLLYMCLSVQYLIGLNMEFWYGVKFTKSYQGIWIGMIVPLVIELLLASFVLLKKIDWNQRVQELQNRLEVSENNKEKVKKEDYEELQNLDKSTTDLSE